VTAVVSGIGGKIGVSLRVLVKVVAGAIIVVGSGIVGVAVIVVTSGEIDGVGLIEIDGVSEVKVAVGLRVADCVLVLI
jgi:hypothetical protein